MNVESNMVLDVTDCWSYLRASAIGRLAVIGDDAPEIFPVTILSNIRQSSSGQRRAARSMLSAPVPVWRSRSTNSSLQPTLPGAW